MKVYRVELMVINFDELDQEELTSVIENTKYPNRCISPDVMEVEAVDIGEWFDEHPLNYTDKREAEFRRLFPKRES